MRKLLLTCMALALIAAPAFASVQNVKVSGDIDSTYLFRKNFDLGVATSPDEYQSLFITQTRLRVDADLTDNVSATIALINERVWTRTQTEASTDIDLNLAFVTLREMLYSPLTVIIGRQDFRYGNSLIIDSRGPNDAAAVDSGLNSVAEDLSKQSAFDAVRAILDYNPLKIEMAFVELDPRASISEGVPSPNDFVLDHSKTDTKLYGINASYEFGDERNSMAEAYIWKKVDRSYAEYGLGEKADTIIVKGIRGSTNIIDALNLQLEYAYQTGSKRLDAQNNKKRAAQALQFIANYQVPLLKDYKPMLQYVFLKATGDTRDNATDAGDYTAWDPMFENQGGGTIYNNLFTLSNCVLHSLALTAVPIEDVTAELKLTSLWLQSDYNTINAVYIYSPDSDGVQQTDSKPFRTHLGKELDLKLTYDYTEDVQIGMNMGWFFPGSIFRIADSQNEHVAKQLLVNCLVKF